MHCFALSGASLVSPVPLFRLSLCTCVPSCLVSGQRRPHSGQIPSGKLPPLPKTTSITGPDNTLTMGLKGLWPHSSRGHGRACIASSECAQVKCANNTQIILNAKVFIGGHYHFPHFGFSSGDAFTFQLIILHNCL